MGVSNNNYTYTTYSEFQGGKWSSPADKKKAWEQDGDLDSVKDGNGIKGEAVDQLIDKFDEIDSSSPDGLINGSEIFKALDAGKLDGDAKKAAILLMTNPDLLKKLDGATADGKQDGLIAKADLTLFSKDHNEQMTESKDKEFNDFKTNMGLINNKASIGFMDKIESALQGHSLDEGVAKNGKFGEMGLSALAHLKDNPDVLKGDDKALDSYITSLGMTSNDNVKEKVKNVVNEFVANTKSGEPELFSSAAANATATMDNNAAIKKKLYGDDGAVSKQDLELMDRWNLNTSNGTFSGDDFAG